MARTYFACHESDENRPLVCAGFFLRGAEHNLQVRLDLMKGGVDRTSVHDGGHALYDSYQAMAEANHVDPDDPALALCRAPRNAGECNVRPYGLTHRLEGGRQSFAQPPAGRGGDVLYLDFDGVLHHEDVWWTPQRGPYFGPKAPATARLFEHAALLEAALAPYPNLRIVLSTSWAVRYSYSKARVVDDNYLGRSLRS